MVAGANERRRRSTIENNARETNFGTVQRIPPFFFFFETDTTDVTGRSITKWY
jgi:hypothetical protein